MNSDEMNTILKILPSFVMQEKVEEGIAIFPSNEPKFRRIVEMSLDARDKVWNWIHNPKLLEKEDWMDIREHVLNYMLTTWKIMLAVF